MSKGGHRVQLQGEELESMRAAAAKALEHIEHIGRVAFEKLGHEGIKPGLHEIGKIIIKPNNSKWIYYNKQTGKCAAVYEDPPGVCRACNDPDSTDGHAE